tara:strand:+ start:265 stop:1188 length:924 start_codon:yes stop_codon:yes gene_type:complete
MDTTPTPVKEDCKASAKHNEKDSAKDVENAGLQCAVEGSLKHARTEANDMREVARQFSRLEVTNKTMMEVIGQVKSMKYYEELKKAEVKNKELEFNFLVAIGMLRKTSSIFHVISSMFKNQLVPKVMDRLMEGYEENNIRPFDPDKDTKKKIDQYISRHSPVLNEDRTELILSLPMRAHVPEGGAPIRTVTLSFRFRRNGENWFFDAVNGHQQDDEENPPNFTISVKDTKNGIFIRPVMGLELDVDGWEWLTQPCWVKDGFVFHYLADRGEEIQEQRQRYVRMHAVDENDQIIHANYYPCAFDAIIL